MFCIYDFFQDLIRFTPKSHADYEGLQKGLQRVTEITTFINEKRRDKESILQVAQLQSQLEGKLVV